MEKIIRQREIERKAREWQATLNSRRQALWAERGERYRNCTLGNYQITCKEQAETVKRLHEYVLDFGNMISDGVNIVLLGPSGTGKDHLVASMFDPAIDFGLTILWTSGVRLFARFRDAIDSSKNETRLISEYTRPDVLVLSDPTPISSGLTDYQRSVLYAIVDERYSAKNPIWATINAAGPNEAALALGIQTVDRLRDGAVSIACNWPSFRKSRPAHKL